MNEDHTIVLPQDWDDVETGYPLVDEGEHHVVINSMTAREGNRVAAEFEVLEGPCEGMTLFQMYALTNPAGKRLLKELFEAVAVFPEGNTMDLSQCRRRAFWATVKHKQRDAKTYANVIRHASAPANRIVD